MHNYDAQQHRAGQIISPLTLQTITTAQMFSGGGEGESMEGNITPGTPEKNATDKILAFVQLSTAAMGNTVSKRSHETDQPTETASAH